MCHLFFIAIARSFLWWNLFGRYRTCYFCIFVLEILLIAGRFLSFSRSDDRVLPIFWGICFLHNFFSVAFLKFHWWVIRPRRYFFSIMSFLTFMEIFCCTMVTIFIFFKTNSHWLSSLCPCLEMKSIFKGEKTCVSDYFIISSTFFPNMGVSYGSDLPISFSPFFDFRFEGISPFWTGYYFCWFYFLSQLLIMVDKNDISGSGSLLVQ